MTQEELDGLTPEQRARLEATEQEALKILNRLVREGRWYPRRHMRFALLIVLPWFALTVFIVLAVISLVD